MNQRLMEQINRAIDADGRSRAELGRAANLHPKTFYEIIRGGNVHVGTLGKLMDILGYDITIVKRK